MNEAKKIITYNVNGIRAAIRKGFIEWLKAAQPDIVCIQETKAHPQQVPVELFEELGYHHYWHSAEKKGYSGVALLSKMEPDKVIYGMEIDKYDREGRMIRADYGAVSVITVYHPSGSSGDARQDFKMKWLEDFYHYINGIKQERLKLVISGDYNICHKPIDIHDPVRNAKNSGFLPEERQWMSEFLDSGFIDSFRYFVKEPHHYSWWNFRGRAREKNLGWRIDYNMVSNPLEENMQRAAILPQAKHSDHCPVLLEMNM
ncbi:MAG: exodeoxyribonuclease III [Bacteroidales bacterium]|nr:exodeoxyribonuclease III [Bacteroidales bacterium]